jgi:signal transduction histidine kinase
MPSAVRSLYAEPRAPGAPARVWRDWVLVAVLVPLAVLELVLRDDVPWPPVAFASCLLTIAALLVRRTRPFAAVAVAFGSFVVADVAALIAGGELVGLDTATSALILGYSLSRWGSGRELVHGVGFMLTAGVLATVVDSTGVVDALAGGMVLFFPLVLGATVRYRAGERGREIDQVKLRERQLLARELHDTVAHHVSAIAIQAQAGRAVAPARPEAALRALEVIEEAASRTLEEMRGMVAVLRDGDEAELTPQRGVADIERLARGADHGPRIAVELAGDLGALRPSLGAAVYRLAQESITNATQHARHATRIDVRVTGDDDCVRLTVHDDGEGASGGAGTSGYGLIGMRERAELLGGTLDAGPDLGRGWTVSAVLPR